eukprot:11256828-Alexandrium_andersonii.AAC.1
MSASLVGSEMCIRDSLLLRTTAGALPRADLPLGRAAAARTPLEAPGSLACLLYTSDAADDM